MLNVCLFVTSCVQGSGVEAKTKQTNIQKINKEKKRKNLKTINKTKQDAQNKASSCCCFIPVLVAAVCSAVQYQLATQVSLQRFDRVSNDPSV